MARIHNRMPVILQNDQINTWLDVTISDAQKLNELLHSPPEDSLDCYPVSSKINSMRFDEAEYAGKTDLDYTASCRTNRKPLHETSQTSYSRLCPPVS